MNNIKNIEPSQTTNPGMGYTHCCAPVHSVVYNEDCIEGLKRFSDNYFDLAIVDPPYGMIGNTFRTINKKFTNGFNSASLDKGLNAKISLGNRPDKTYFVELFRVSKNQICFGMQYFTNNLPPTQCVLIWDKKNGNSKQSSSELAWTSFDTKVNTFYYDARSISKIHPTQKPVALYEWILQNYASEGNLILDTHVGSGSSRIACDKGGFNFIGFEIDKDYWEAQEKRFSDYKRQLRLF